MKSTANFQHRSEAKTSPIHIAIIMDGNGRWAKAKGLPRTAGHRKGAEAVKEMVKSCIEFSVPYLTLYAFSSENWNRSPSEVNDLMGLLRFYLGKEIKQLHKNNVCVHVIGDRSRLTKEIQKEITKAENLTKDNTALHLTIALSYGSRQEIVDAVKAIATRVESGELAADSIDESAFETFLYTKTLPDPDLLIRSGGEKRLSNFLLWQSAYAELYFTDTLWPDFAREDLKIALDEFQSRERRYGTA